MSQSRARVAHIGIAVADLDEAAAFYRDVLGLTTSLSETADGANIVSVRLGDVDVEFLTPATPDGPIARFLTRRGPGIHHICYRVPDLDQALASARMHGYRLIDEQPRTGAGGHRIAFLHPKGTGGILIELTD
ncbi:MAG TPA: methylmalonyl-CoA epimerase [Acidimicrobiia bacterium]